MSHMSSCTLFTTTVRILLRDEYAPAGLTVSKLHEHLSDELVGLACTPDTLVTKLIPLVNANVLRVVGDRYAANRRAATAFLVLIAA